MPRCAFAFARRDRSFCGRRGRIGMRSREWLLSNGAHAERRRRGAEIAVLRVSIPTRISIQPKGREKLQALDSVLKLLGDLLGAGDDVVHLQEALLFGDVEAERHD